MLESLRSLVGRRARSAQGTPFSRPTSSCTGEPTSSLGGGLSYHSLATRRRAAFTNSKLVEMRFLDVNVLLVRCSGFTVVMTSVKTLTAGFSNGGMNFTGRALAGARGPEYIQNSPATTRHSTRRDSDAEREFLDGDLSLTAGHRPLDTPTPEAPEQAPVIESASRAGR
jgi:hypothetical protein